MRRVGDLAPKIVLNLTDGRAIDLSEPLPRPLVLFFYPKALSLGCSAHACGFIGFEGADVVGVSRDPLATQEEFRRRRSLSYPLVSDPEGVVAAAFGVRRPGPLPPARVTFVIGEDRRIRLAYWNELLFSRHAEVARKAVALDLPESAS